jgi:hypothetical protein
MDVSRAKHITGVAGSKVAAARRPLVPIFSEKFFADREKIGDDV